MPGFPEQVPALHKNSLHRVNLQEMMADDWLNGVEKGKEILHISKVM